MESLSTALGSKTPGLTQLLAEIPYWEEVPHALQAMVVGVLPAMIILGVVITPVGLLGVWAERRLSGRIQSRIGPNRVGIQWGPFKKWKWARLWGLPQSLADGIKLLGKEDFVPPLGSPILFLMAPLIVFAGSMALFAVLPLSDGLLAFDLELGVFYALAVGAVEIIGVLMAGWASNNKWSLLGAMREAAQMVSYEVPLGLTILLAVLHYGNLNLRVICEQQAGGFLNIGNWTVIRNPIFAIPGFLIFFMGALANAKRAPFDLPEAESELVSGFHTQSAASKPSEKLVLTTIDDSQNIEESRKSFRDFLRKLGVPIEDEPTPA